MRSQICRELGESVDARTRSPHAATIVREPAATTKQFPSNRTEPVPGALDFHGGQTQSSPVVPVTTPAVQCGGGDRHRRTTSRDAERPDYCARPYARPCNAERFNNADWPVGGARFETPALKVFRPVIRASNHTITATGCPQCADWIVWVYVDINRMRTIFRVGAQRTLVWGADSSGKYRARDYYENLSQTDKTKFEPSFGRMAATGRITNDLRFRRESNGISVFKIHKHRLACFSDGRDVVLIHGFVKKSDRGKKEAREIATAANLRDDYLKRRNGPNGS
jgi:hypothetical protein